MTGSSSEAAAGSSLGPRRSLEDRALEIENFRVCLHVAVHRLVVDLHGRRYVARTPSAEELEYMRASLSTPRRWRRGVRTGPLPHLLYSAADGSSPTRSDLAALARDRGAEILEALELLRIEADAPPDPRLESFERDMLDYAHRDDRPFRTRIVGIGPRSVVLRFPDRLLYESEGQIHELQRGDGPEALPLGLTIAHTSFGESGLSILHLVFEPQGSTVSEWELIKLAKLWQGGEILALPFSVELDGELIGPPIDRSDPLTDWPRVAEEVAQRLAFLRTETARAVESQIRSLALTVLGRRSNRVGPALAGIRSADRVGTIALLHLPDAESLFERSDELVEDPTAMPADGRSWERLVALGGVLQALLDFRAINAEELADVFRGATGTPENGEGGVRDTPCFHKGTLVSIDAEPDERSLAWPTGVDPYIAVPQAVVLHNEQRLNEALAAAAQPRATTTRLAAADSRISHMRRLVGEPLANLFHYPTERAIYSRAEAARDVPTLRERARQSLERAEKELEGRERKRATWALIFGLTLTVVTAIESLLFSSADIEAWYIAIVLPVLLFFVFVSWYLRQ